MGADLRGQALAQRVDLAVALRSLEVVLDQLLACQPAVARPSTNFALASTATAAATPDASRTSGMT